MSRSASQLNIRSNAAKQRVSELVRETGKTATQVVEEALQAYRPQPPVTRPALPDGFEYRNGFIVQTNRPPMTLEEHLQVIEDVREDRIRHILGDYAD